MLHLESIRRHFSDWITWDKPHGCCGGVSTWKRARWSIAASRCGRLAAVKPWCHDPPHGAWGEGLQHQDGSNLLQAAAVPNCRAYDPRFAEELVVILDYGMPQIVEQQDDVFHYVTLMNENDAHPSLPERVHGDVIRRP